jgi:putative endopeptidase
MRGQKQESSLDDQALSICSDMAGDTLGKLYIESDIAKFRRIKKGATEIIKKVKKAARERIMKLNWLSESSRLIACNKLDKMNLKVAYPDVWYDTFKGIEMDKTQFLLNILALMKKETLYEIGKLTKQTDKDKKLWESPCFEVNAFYYSEMNEFCIPIGFLFSPFYSESMTFVQIIAGLGNIVGHEISHGFDKDGRKFDENGNNYPWWTSLDLELYHSKTKQIIELFNNEIYHGLHVNGELTLDENLADFGALAICLDVLHNEWADSPISESEKKRQLREFFVWYSKTWAYKDTRAHQKMAIKTNVHAPAELRVNTLVPHFEEFYYAFGFDEKHEGYIAPEDRVDVWGK